ncbi:thioredoxin-domain-containing protein [Mycena floridula]|nr:thioredoxin-domain-containing protein [Mycena floridula]
MVTGGNIVEIQSTSQWDQSLRDAKLSGRTVIVDFTASWCGPCQQIAPIYEKLSVELPQAVFLKVDVDEQQPIALKYQVTAMPTFIVFKAGKPVDTVIRFTELFADMTETFLQLKGADPYGLARMCAHYAGPNPPIPPLPEAAEEAKAAGNAHFSKGNYGLAVQKYTEAIAIVDTSAPLFANRSIAYLKYTPPYTGPAVQDARKATTIDPSWGKGWVRLGDALVAHGAPQDEAKEAYKKALELIKDPSMVSEIQSKMTRLGSEPVSAAL